MDRNTRLNGMIKLDGAITTVRYTWRDRLARLYRLTIRSRMEIFPRLAIMGSTTRKLRLTSLAIPTWIRRHIRIQCLG